MIRNFLLLQFYLHKHIDDIIWLQIGANLILLAITNLMGMLAFYVNDKKQRRAFIDTRQSLEMKLVIEEQAKEQVFTVQSRLQSFF